jgi:hypothetical protein|tara:strand:+ start:60 stop:359 length:300 start_codon:yes stop_codon:yes gene_type:complete
MDATDIVIGVILMGVLVWVSIIALNQGSSNTALADLYTKTALNKTLISHPDVCPDQLGFELIGPDNISREQYFVSSGYTDFNQSYFCFYKEIGPETDST